MLIDLKARGSARRDVLNGAHNAGGGSTVGETLSGIPARGSRGDNKV